MAKKPADDIHSALGAKSVAQSVAHSMDKLAGKLSARQALVENHRASEHLFKPKEESHHTGDGPSTSLRREVAAAGKKTDTYAAAKDASKKYHDALADKRAAVQRGDTKAAAEHHERAQNARLDYEKAKVAHWKSEEGRLADAHKEQLARLSDAKKGPDDVQTGKRGGRFTITASGGKKYVP